MFKLVFFILCWGLSSLVFSEIDENRKNLVVSNEDLIEIFMFSQNGSEKGYFKLDVSTQEETNLGQDLITIWFFSPSSADCSKTKFIQLAKSVPAGITIAVNTEWHIDSNYENFPYYEHQLGQGSGSVNVITDDPGYENWIGNQSFETCAVCTEGEDIGLNYGCIRWKVKSKLFGKKIVYAPAHKVQPLKPSEIYRELSPEYSEFFWD